MVDKYLIGSVSRISPEAPVPVVLVNRIEMRLGGAGNVINNLLSMGARVKVLSFVGKDDGGKYLKQQMDNSNVETDYLFLIEGYKTGTKTRITSQNQQLLRFDEEKSLPTPQSIIKEVKNHTNNIFSGKEYHKSIT